MHVTAVTDFMSRSYNKHNTPDIHPTTCGRQEVVKRPAGVAPEMNLRDCVIPLPSANATAHSGLKLRGDMTRNPKHRCPWPVQGTCDSQ